MKKLHLFLVLGCVFLLAQPLSSRAIPDLDGRINDHANLLNPSQEATLEKLLISAEDKTTSQFVLLTIPSLDGDSLEGYSIRVAEKWKIGQRGLDNGVILLITRTEKKIRIEVGYGLESVLTDLKCGYIIRQVIIPWFKKGDFYRGIFDGFKAVTGIVNKEYEISPEDLKKYQDAQKKSNKGHIPFGLIIFIIFILINIFRGGGRGGRGGRRGGTPIFWGGGFGGGSSGGFGGGGFSGGGGSFGGGGASGGW